MHKRPLIPGHSTLMLVMLVTLCAACSTKPELAAQPAPALPHLRVRAAPVELARLARPIRASGVLMDDEERSLAFAVDGVVARISLDEGDSFRRGQILARLELDAVNAHVAQSHSALARAERDLVRANALATSGALPTQTLDDAHTSVEVTRAQARAAGFARRHAVLVAQDDGVVLARHAEIGEVVRAGAPVLVVALASSARVARVMLTDREVVRIRHGDNAALTLDAFPGRTLTATVVRVAAAADPATGLHAVDLASPAIATLSERAVAGLVARVTITPSDASDVSLVPSEALVEADEHTGIVWALSPDERSASRRTVQIAFLADARVAVSSGLGGVHSVVTSGAAYVRDGLVLDVHRDAVLPSRSAP